MGPPQYPTTDRPTQEPTSATSWFRCRRCLLKGCEQSFRPRHPQERYCCPRCRQEAAHWRRWHSSRTYRASEPGKQRRQQQSRRYRERLQQRREEKLRASEAVAEEAQASIPAPSEPVPLDPVPAREGQRAASNLENWEEFSGQPCQRPGCYVLFPLRPSVPQQRFCSCPCRQALRRVLDRGARWRQRRRRPQGSWRSRRRPRPPPRF